MEKRGMITLEACVLTVLVALSLLASEKYFRGALQGNWRGNTDSFSDEQYNPSDDEELDPGSSSETIGNIIIVNPTLQADIGIDGTPESSFDLAGGLASQYIQLTGWGTYSDPRSHSD